LSTDGLVTAKGTRARIRRALGGYSPVLRWYRRVRPPWLWKRVNPLGRATARYVREQGLVVKHGLFQGMRYPEQAVGRVGYLPTKLLGCYEPELAPVLARATDFDLFVDVGCGDGFYCVGYARLSPTTRVIGFETDPQERAVAEALARENRVEVEVRGTADHAALNDLSDGRLLLMSDVEGYERELLDPDRAPRLRTASMLVELHPNVHPDVADVLASRFGETHAIELIHGRPKSPHLLDELRGWDAKATNLAVTEGRSALPTWMWLERL
jgi:SAM-dependent methyltransferase